MNALRIFIVDDDQDFAESLADIFESRGHYVKMAFSGEEAVRTFRADTFDITFMDVKLPGMNGVESFLEIRKIRPDAKVVMMTAYSLEQLLQKAIDEGALGVLHKPFDGDELFRMLDSVKPAGIVLVADDDPEFIDSLRPLLTDRGYTVLIAYTGNEAIDKVLANGIDVMLLDLKLPVLSGLEVYLELKKHGRTVPTIIVTGYAAEESESIDALRSMSVTGCLVKPFAPEALMEAIGAIVTEAG